MGAIMKKTEAIDIFGSEAKLAQALGLSRSAVNQWGDEVPQLRAYQIRDILAERSAEQPHQEQQAA